MLTMRLSVVLVVSVLLVACAPQRPQVASPQVATTESVEPAEVEQELPNDLLELTVLGPLPEGCTTEVLYRYDRANGVWMYMHPDRERPNRFYGSVLPSNFAPTFTVASRCKADLYKDFDAGYKEYHGPVELWRRAVHGSWEKLQPELQYEAWWSH